MTDLMFDKSFDAAYGEAVSLLPGLRRVTANNPSPTTFRGTNSYIIGEGEVAILDPGPDDANHVAALLAATKGETIGRIILTHTHRDHVGALNALRGATGATIIGGGPHRPSRPPRAGEEIRLDAAGDASVSPDIIVSDGMAIEGNGWTLEAVATPGHTANHFAYALAGTPLLFSGDHVMAWSTTIVAPPDGAMQDYMASLDRLAARPEQRYLPGHGGPVEDAANFVRALKGHRRMREAAIMDRLGKGDRTIAEMVAVIYRDTDPRLHRAAGLTVLAHLEDLVARGKVLADGPPAVESVFTPA